MNSKAFAELLAVQIAAADAAARSYEVGVIQRTPVPDLSSEQVSILANLARETWNLRLDIDSSNETSRNYIAPALAQNLSDESSSLNRRIIKIENEINGIVAEILELDCEAISTDHQDVTHAENSTVEPVVSWLVGVAFGRFSSSLETLSTGDARSRRSPFDAPRLMSPGMAGAESSQSGILTSDRSHEHCLVEKVERIAESTTFDLEFDSSWIERGFFESHLAQYSESRRNAPIYWPISTESGSYTLWFYYHRLTDQTLYKAVNDFVDPKLKQTLRQLADLRAIKDRASSQEKELAQLTELESDLTQFKADLLEIAAFWKPNLNDGVQITAAPLWKFFRLTKWRNKLKKTWSELESGKYDWSHLALSIWPDRVVREKCTTDRSIAIAHDLEEKLWHEVEIEKTSKTGRVTKKMVWQYKELSDDELDAIVEEVKGR